MNPDKFVKPDRKKPVKYTLKKRKKQVKKGTRKPVHGQALLIQLLWKKHGGPFEVAKKLDIPWYKPGNWSHDGRVPKNYLADVAMKLKCPVEGLNYDLFKKTSFGRSLPTWGQVVRSYGFEREEEKRILKLGEP